MVYTQDVIESLVEAACDHCHYTYTCGSDEELQNEHCADCFCETAMHFIEELKNHAVR